MKKNVMRRNKTLQFVILAAVLVIGGYAVFQSLFQTTAVMKAGNKPPEFRLLGLDGTAHDLSEYKGKPLILNFWGTWCPPCRAEMPALQSVYDRWKDKGVQLVGINLSEEKLTVQNFAREVGASFPILLDRNRQTEKKYGLKQYPTTFFIGADGKIQDIMIGGPLSENDIESRIAKLMNAKS
ncbi:redoxin domain-containing protein [Cohnella pontilimi]|uniref:redoxin domain-containing protein n=1 Tax=Cohnella pontilimi TaxID=2564100 RepID=UPI003CCC8453